MTGRVSLAFALSLAAFLAAGPARAQTCTATDFGAVVDQTAQALRELNGSGSKRYQAKVAALREKHKLSEEDIEARTTGLNDERIASYNREVETLVGQMDVLSQTPNNKITCDKLDELKRVRDRLLTVMGQKSGYMLAKIEAELESPTPAKPVPTPATTASTDPAPQPEPVKPEPVKIAEPAAAPLAIKPPATAESRLPVGDSKPRQADAPRHPDAKQAEIKQADAKPVTETKQNLAAARPGPEKPAVAEKSAAAEYTPPPAVPQRAPAPTRLARNGDRDLPPLNEDDRPTTLAPPPAYGERLSPPGAAALPEETEEGYSINEIREAGRGVFGTITAEFAGAINYAFQQFGQPNAYISGVEGGAAFLAGLRYGKGTIFRKSAGPSQIYWQGPSAGLDFGAEGSRALFLVYNLDDPTAIYGRFSGIGGSAYVAGGVGLNVLGKGNIVMVPIRSGLGLRLGANLAYVKFTERQTWNPF